MPQMKCMNSDREASQIAEHGPLCAVYDGSSFDDPDEVAALASDDNLNAMVQMNEDEMQAFGRVDAMVDRFARDQGVTETTHQAVIAALEAVGLGHFSKQDWQHFVALRASLPASIAKILQFCQFSAVASRVRVKPSDFGMAAKLDPRALWSKVAVMLWQYIGSCPQKALSQGDTVVTFAGRKEW